MKAIDRMLQQWRIAEARPWLEPGMRVLDIGCADGALFRLNPGLRDGVGIDPDVAAPQQVGTNLLLPGLFPEALPDHRPFDAITMLAVLEHVPTHLQDRLARDCFQAIAPGGHLLITSPRRQPTTSSRCSEACD